MARRPKDRGLILLRRSGDRQETSLQKQLTWALGEANRLGITVDATSADLKHMETNALHSHKSIRLDDAIPGDELDRPGLTALIDDATGDRRYSHVFVFARDRLGRPQSPVDMMAKELRLLRAGLTLVYLDKVLDLPASGELDIAELIKMLVDYHVSGEHPRKLAEQMIVTQRLLAEQGRSIGGNPPYGFVRALVNAGNEILEYLPKGKRVRQLGCHVVWVPDPNDNGQSEQSKLRVWLMMLAWKERGWGYKRIANSLNELRIPSPASGNVRKVRGRACVNDGLWSHTTVKSLLENRTILALLDYGRRSEGKHRRLGPTGPRFVEERDLNEKGRPKVIRNDQTLVITRPLPFQAKFDPTRWQRIREQTLRRGAKQTGIPRVRDPAKYPLSCRVIDLTDGCGSVMYGRTSGRRRLYTCGRYMKGGGAACANNQVDAEAILRFSLATISEVVDRLGARPVLRQKLLERARQPQAADDGQESQRRALENRFRELKQHRETASRNALLTEDPELRSDAERMFVDIKNELRVTQARLEKLGSAARDQHSPEAEVEKALVLLDHIQRVADDPTARADVPQLMNVLGLRVGLRFSETIKGKKR